MFQVIHMSKVSVQIMHEQDGQIAWVNFIQVPSSRDDRNSDARSLSITCQTNIYTDTYSFLLKVCAISASVRLYFLSISLLVSLTGLTIIHAC